MPKESFDLAVIGAGPGGYVAALRAAQLGLKTALIERGATLGGTCLNVGCIPSKALLHLSEQYHFVSHQASALGIKTGKVELDLAAFMQNKEKTVAGLVKGVELLVSKRGIRRIQGTGSFKDRRTVTVQNGETTTEITAKHIVIATGSVPVTLPFLPFDGKTVVSSDDAIAFSEVPKKLVVVGAGAIGLELGSVWSRLGSEVTVLEFLPKIAAGFDDDISRTLQRLLTRQGMKFEVSTKVTGLRREKKQAIVQAEREGEKLEFPADKVLVAVGRAPFTGGLGLETVGVELDEKKRIRTDKQFKTNVPGVYAIGDVIAGPMLAHKGEEEGIAVAELIAGRAGHVNYATIPNVIYTEPEVAGVGIGEDQAKAEGIAVKVGRFSFAANGRALSSGAADGFAKVIADAATDRILGVHILSRSASELIAEAVAHMEYGGSAEDLGRTVHAHPTLSEAVKEAALAVHKSAIHAL